MKNGKGLLLAIGSGLLIAGGVAFFTKKHSSSITPPDFNDIEFSQMRTAILNATDTWTLNGYHTQIGGMLNAGLITIGEYDLLYAAYVKRFYEIVGVAA